MKVRLKVQKHGHVRDTVLRAKVGDLGVAIKGTDGNQYLLKESEYEEVLPKYLHKKVWKSGRVAYALQRQFTHKGKRLHYSGGSYAKKEDAMENYDLFVKYGDMIQMITDDYRESEKSRERLTEIFVHKENLLKEEIAELKAKLEEKTKAVESIPEDNAMQNIMAKLNEIHNEIIQTDEMHMEETSERLDHIENAISVVRNQNEYLINRQSKNVFKRIFAK